jgi:hypothetical protein
VSKIKGSPLFALVLVLGVSLAPSSAAAAPALRWSLLGGFDVSGGTPTGLSCASETLCVAVDSKGNAFSTSDPTASDPTWSRAEVDPGEALSGVSCAPSGPCVVVDAHGRAFASAGPGPVPWSTAAIIPNGGTALTGVSCPSASLCVAVDAEGDVATSSDPLAGAWTLASTHPGHDLDAVSCASSTLCVAVDAAGDVLASANPTGAAGAWSEQTVDFQELLAVSCWAAGSCLAVDRGGTALASGDPLAKVALEGTEPPTPAATWSRTPIDGERLAGASCASSGVCVAIDDDGGARAGDDSTAAIPTWSSSSADTQPLTAISCLAGGMCLALDAAGRALAARVPLPEAETEKALEVTSSSATLAGVADPEDATLTACTFEYGISEAGYSQSAPCAPPPSAIGGAQAVSAALAGLLPNTAYHYRLTVSSPQGMATGAVESFTTPTSSQVALVHPSPSISGTPANGQRLTCHAGLPAGASAVLAYAWLRDQIPIQGAISSTYTVKGQDSGHHLQCEVTATDGGGSVTAKSAFVTIPVGGVPASAGETSVGRASFKNGRLSVPVSCSAQASGGCQLTLRLTSVETLSGGRVVAIAARARRTTHERAAHGRAAAASQRTITLADVRVRVAPGMHTAVFATLAASSRRLLASARRFTAELRVNGTVIGVIEAQLAQQVLTLTAPPRRAASHASRRR